MGNEKHDFISELTDRILKAPLPSFPLRLKDYYGAPVLYHFTNKLQYEEIYFMILRPILAEIFARIPMVHLLRNGGDLSHNGHRQRFLEVINAYRFSESGVVMALGNDASEVSIVESMRGDVINSDRYYTELFNANRLLDPQVFRITNTIKEREYAFCHTARLIPEKRHELLLGALNFQDSGIDWRGIVLSSGINEPEYYKSRLAQRIKSAGIILHVGLNPDRVNDYLNKSFIGLALSEGEGQCMAVGEYLLAGLPVLTITGARGGRNLFLNESNAVFCDSNESSVARGIETLLKKRPNRQLIRDHFAKLCLPNSYWDLQDIAASAAMQSNIVLGSINKRMIDRLIKYSTMIDWGIERKTVTDVCASLAINMNGVVLRNASVPVRGLRIFLQGFKKVRKYSFYGEHDTVELTPIGFALWNRNIEDEPSICLRTQDGDSLIVPLDRVGIVSAKLGGTTLSFIIHKGGRF